MGLFDSLAGEVSSALSGSQGSDNQDSLLQAATHLLTNSETGGMQGLIKSFQDQGLGESVASWLGNGQNMTITADQIQQVIGSDRLSSIAQKFGLTPATLSSGLAEILPHVIDNLSPNGQLPENHLLEQGISMLRGKLFS